MGTIAIRKHPCNSRFRAYQRESVYGVHGIYHRIRSESSPDAGADILLHKQEMETDLCAEDMQEWILPLSSKTCRILLSKPSKGKIKDAFSSKIG